MRVLDLLTVLFCDKYGCDTDSVEMSATLDDLNIAPHERLDMAMVLGETYGLDMDAATVREFETVEDVVGYVEDILNERGDTAT